MEYHHPIVDRLACTKPKLSEHVSGKSNLSLLSWSPVSQPVGSFRFSRVARPSRLIAPTKVARPVSAGAQQAGRPGRLRRNPGVAGQRQGMLTGAVVCPAMEPLQLGRGTFSLLSIQNYDKTKNSRSSRRDKDCNVCQRSQNLSFGILHSPCWRSGVTGKLLC